MLESIHVAPAGPCDTGGSPAVRAWLAPAGTAGDGPSGETPPPHHPHSPHPLEPPRHLHAQRRRRRIILATVAAVLVLVVAIAAVAWLDRSTGSSSASPYPNPNPGNVPILAVQGQINFTGNASGYLEIDGGSNLCPQCPVVPTEDERYTPPVAGFWFFLNVTNVGSIYHSVTAFKLVSPTYGSAPIFLIRAVFCCGPSYEEAAESVGFTPGQTIGLEVFVQSTSIPSTGPPGYDLDFYLLTAD